jgi:glycosyltransferase involved in cell wall biosynthesis
MKILQVLPRYAPAWAYGGGVQMFWMLARELARRGHHLEVVTSDSLSRDARFERLEEDLEAGIHVRRYRNRYNSMSATLPAVFYRPRSMREGLRAAVAGVDVVHMGESRGIHNVWTAEATSHAGVPLVWSAFGGLPTAAGVRGLYRRAHDVLWTRRVVPRVAAFVAQTPHERAVYIEHGAPPQKIREIPLCVDLSAFEKIPPRGELRRRLGLMDSDQLIVCVARLAPVKGLELLVEAHAQIPATARGPHLALVGWDHGSLEALRSLAVRLGVAGRVHFPGALFGDDRLLAYSDADVFALAPIVFEETSLAALEAAASGSATVLTPHCEVPGLAAAGGGLVVPRDPAAFAGAVAGLLEEDDRRAAMGEKARAHVRSNFSVEHVTDLHEALFRGLAG